MAPWLLLEILKSTDQEFSVSILKYRVVLDGLAFYLGLIIAEDEEHHRCVFSTHDLTLDEVGEDQKKNQEEPEALVLFPVTQQKPCNNLAHVYLSISRKMINKIIDTYLMRHL